MKTFLLALVAAVKFVYFDGDRSVATNMDLEMLLELKERHRAPFIWFRDERGTFLIRDAATLEEVERIYAPLRALDPEYRAVHDKLRPLERRERELERLEDEIEERIESYEDRELTAEQEAEIRRLEARQRELETQLRELEKELRVVEAEERRIDKRQNELEKAADRAVRKVVEEAVRRGVAERQ